MIVQDDIVVLDTSKEFVEPYSNLYDIVQGALGGAIGQEYTVLRINTVCWDTFEPRLGTQTTIKDLENLNIPSGLLRVARKRQRRT